MRLFLLDTTRWQVGGRLAARFIALGCEVATVRLPKGYSGDEVRGISKRYRYNGLDPMSSIRGAMRDFDPDIAIPVCSPAHGEGQSA